MEKINIMETLRGAKEGDVFMNLLDGTRFVFRDGDLIVEGGYFEGENITDMYRLKDITSMMFYKISETNFYSKEDLPYGVPKKITFINGIEKVYLRIKIKDRDVWNVIDAETKRISTESRIKDLKWENVLKVEDYI